METTKLEKLIIKDVELRGSIHSIEPKDRTQRKDPTNNFTVLTDKSRKTIKVRCPFFCPIHEGDRIAAFGVSDPEQSGGFITLLSPPLVLIGTEESTIRNCLHSALNRSIKSAKDRIARVESLMSHLIKVVRMGGNLLDKTGDLIDQFLRELSEEYSYSRDSALLETFDSMLNSKQCQTLFRWWFKQRCLRRLYLLGLTLSEIRDIEIRPSVLFEQALENPYTIPAIDISKCEHIMKLQGKTPTDEQIKSGQILRWIYKACKCNHWSYVPLVVLKEYFGDQIDKMALGLEKYGILIIDDKVYLKGSYDLETAIMDTWNQTGAGRSKEEVNKMLQELPKHLSEDQKEAINLILSNKWSILTGPAGTGKTTILQTLVDILNNNGREVLIVSFTGKAVARIMEVLGTSTFAVVSTIHRFLAAFNDDTPRYDHVFIDEASMTNLPLFGKLICRLIKPFNLTLIGDPKQLPPIHWSSPFESLIKSNMITHAKLEKVHRTTELEGNGIYINSMKIRNWNPEEPLNIERRDNFQMVNGTISTVKQIVKSLIDSGIPLDSMVVICPVNKYLDELNNIMRSHLPNPESVIDSVSGKNWKIGDRVMLTKNNYDIGIMNGEEGIVTQISPQNITVKFDKYTGNDSELPHEKVLGFSLKDPNDEDIILDDDAMSGDLSVKYLNHSFAVTIHKSQGSEKRIVIFFIPPETTAGSFFSRKLIYTAVTRASKGIFIIGNINSFLSGIATEDEKIFDSLEERFKKLDISV